VVNSYWKSSASEPFMSAFHALRERKSFSGQIGAVLESCDAG
jgi:hypothetical protein